MDLTACQEEEKSQFLSFFGIDSYLASLLPGSNLMPISSFLLLSELDVQSIIPIRRDLYRLDGNRDLSGTRVFSL